MLVFPWTLRKQDPNDLYFFELNMEGGKKVKVIKGGDLLVKYDPKIKKIIYLTNKDK